VRRLRRVSVNPQRAQGNELQKGEREIAERVKEIANRLIVATGETYSLYVRLDPRGRQLTPEDQLVAQNRLEQGSASLRDVDIDRHLVRYLADRERFDLRPTIAVLRVMQRSLILALSNHAQRRANAISLAELHARMRPVHGSWVEWSGSNSR
jgi:hypothetical protein